MENKVCFLSIDVEHDYGEKNKEFQGIERLKEILGVLQKHEVPATLFITGKALEQYSSTIKELENNYEIASHSYSHVFWNKLNTSERREELEKFINVYQDIFKKLPKGFRAPSHIIDEDGLRLLEEKGFLYDSSIVPHYPPFKDYRGYKKKGPLVPYYPNIKDIRKKGEMKILEIPVAGQIFGIPIAGVWLAKIPFFVLKSLFKIKKPNFITINMHSWDILDTPFRKSYAANFFKNLDQILNLLKKQNYKFLSGEEIYELFSKNRK
ncbi:MAG TPA: polysaccharide deacetylase family protein [Candidatus Parcubacteria bacterium]|jgi:peptidoglycan/xylan/chitin deacetylase (PgdA/CDA1 family)|nr:polysaccharide deacetylase family protein [Candidatus Parcubacteria bacterium]|tara:strand:+ start:1580 stop:2377 length:798 start_codon:yes stop_codon:yes gene_type:complete